MNLFEQLLEDLNAIAAESSTKEKQKLLTSRMSDPDFRTLVEYMLNPYKMFGINDFMPGVEPFGRIPTLEDLTVALDNMVARQLTGNSARRYMGQLVSDGIPGDLMLRILNKDPKAGFQETLVNKVVKGFLPEFPYMRCSLPESSNLKKFDWSKGVYSQLKADGMFANVNHDAAGQVQISSRNGTLFPSKGFETLHECVQARLHRNTQTHGELLVYKNGKPLPRQEGNGMINSIIQGGTWEEGCELRFFAWDQILLSEVKPKVRYHVPYQQRFRSLSEQIFIYPHEYNKIQLIETRLVYSLKAAYQHFKEKLEEGLEGTIIKLADAIYMDGTSKDQVKMKLEFDVDVEITGFTEGKGKYAKTFGAIQYQSRCGQLKGKTSGITDPDRAFISKNREAYLGTIMTVKANAVFEPSPSNPLHTLSHPRVVEFRKDKTVADGLPQILAAQAAAIEAAELVK